ncbi:isochorismatase family protein [Mycolicibacterium goodii]|uniref:isochorismatase family protein n=1 Tax=Mycolicibacterium goodii TaxID=134601 RepID=UPI001BDD9E7D|nr:isochorismatase family protein [Mycolicibacterium goodii]MBU8816795.1 isochorismatase family protein [Mycolicibacterium goodii]MBU8828278.1 isochorismatase family protein [Mycolicibacterium goodii]
MTSPRRALVLVDIQNDYFGGPLEIQYPPRDTSLKNITKLIECAESAELPVVVVQHSLPADAPLFATDSEGWQLHPEVASRVRPCWKQVTKQFGTVFGGTDVAEWLAEQGVDTVTIAGYMTNNCDLATVAEAEVHGLSAEIISDATGAVHLANDQGEVSAEQVHTTLMVLMHSNFAAVATTEQWITAVSAQTALEKSDLGSSALQGARTFEQ